MDANQFVQIVTHLIYVAIFVGAAVQAVRRPRPAAVDAALFFGATSLIIALSWIPLALGTELPAAARTAEAAVLMALPYLLFRLLEDFAGPRRVVRVLAPGGLLLSIAALVAWPAPFPGVVVAALVLYFVLLAAYVGVAFWRLAAESVGITRRRLLAVAAGTMLLGVIIVLAGVAALAPAQQWVSPVSSFAGLGTALCYVVGFIPPGWLRRAWQEPELREFVARSAQLPYLSDRVAVIRELARGAAACVGSLDATIGLWLPRQEALAYSEHPLYRSDPEGAKQIGFTEQDGLLLVPPHYVTSGRALLQQQSILVEDVTKPREPSSAAYAAAGIRSVLAAPLIAGGEPMGVLAVYSGRPPIFVDDDMVLLRLVADHAAVVLQARQLLEDAARTRAREETARIKEDFLSSMAHDLRTPITTVGIRAQRLRRRAEAISPALVEDVDPLVREVNRLTALINEMLDASVAEEGRLAMRLEPGDLVDAARAAVARMSSSQHRYVLDAPSPVEGLYDVPRVTQLLQNLLDNATKYSPDGGEVRVRVWQEGDEARIAIRDQGIGIPREELPHLFERFHRGANIDHRRFVGVGLGLYLCRIIAEGHGGRIWAESGAGGSTLHVALPVGSGETRRAGLEGSLAPPP